MSMDSTPRPGREVVGLTMPLPVYLPGADRDWTRAEGMGVISEDGTITIKLQDRKAAEKLVDMALRGMLYQIAFDYKMTPEQLEKTLNRYKKG